MLENTPLLPSTFSEGRTVPTGGKALHAVGWNDLTARINAARDLRELLRRDLVMGGASFTDAAAGYFAKPEDLPEEGKHDVNQDALEGCKSSDSIEESREKTDGNAPSGPSLQEGDREQ